MIVGVARVPTGDRADESHIGTAGTVEPGERAAGDDWSGTVRPENRLCGRMSTETVVAETFVCDNAYHENEYRSLITRVGVRLVAMANGKVDFFNDTGGYGFIATDDSYDDVFFHMEDVGGEDLTEGTEIEFDIEQAPKGPRATNVVRN
jgi:CspA family cold shock protein